jgi:hypothetical protein
MPRKPTPEPAEVEHVRQLAEQLAAVEAEVERLRAERDKAIVTAKLAGATGDQLAAAARITRRNVYGALRAAGHDPNAWRDAKES